jgi:hypothetical protein
MRDWYRDRHRLASLIAPPDFASSSTPEGSAASTSSWPALSS